MIGAMLVAALVDAAVGWPDAASRRIGHPVIWIGSLIGWLSRHLNQGPPARRRAAGVLTVLLVVGAAALPALLVQATLPDGIVGAVMAGLLAWPLVAIRGLRDHVAAVARPLARGDPARARRAVAMIVGRDPDRLDHAGIARAAIESLAENASDGVTAPLFWGAVLGLPGLAAYKAINTMDSMIGHRTPELVDFGRAAARLDDLVNLVPARLTGGLFALVSRAPRTVFAAMRRDAPHHRSPNAGWPESAMAAALGIRLSGPRTYADGMSQEPWLNAGAPDPGASDIARAMALCGRALAVGLVAMAALAAALA